MPSLMGSASGGFRETNGTASAVAGSSAAWACLLLFVLIFAGVVVGGGLILIGACISASPSRSLAGPATPVGTILAVRWPNKGWSRPIMASWRPRSRHNSRQRGQGAAGGPSADLAIQYDHAPPRRVDHAATPVKSGHHSTVTQCLGRVAAAGLHLRNICS